MQEYVVDLNLILDFLDDAGADEVRFAKVPNGTGLEVRLSQRQAASRLSHEFLINSVELRTMPPEIMHDRIRAMAVEFRSIVAHHNRS